MDLVRTLVQPVLAEPGNLWAAFPWGGQDARVQTKTLTHTNTGDTAVTLDLATQGSEFPETLDVRLPGAATYYRTPGLTWDSSWETGTSSVRDAGRTIKRGTTKEVWNAAVTGTATLTGDGRTIAETTLAGCLFAICELTADLPGQRADYVLTTSMRRQVPHSALSTSVETSWTFTSGRTSEAKPLPLLAVRYAPAGLDAFSRARPGTVTRVPVRVERNPGAPQARVTSFRLEVSSDDGATWLSVPSVPTGSGWTAAVPNPRTAGFVSLRATATDTSGTTVKQTVIRAYAVG
ncbi:hypothetical protein [Nonomuraea sp. NPDC049158]|uniref:hypothetical protein n=1 Tax=Nonomuraea sp. NPDC049158 TaxID=3155649 RepID=UPI00340FAD7C